MTGPLRLLAFRVMDPGVDSHFFHKVQTEDHELPLTLNGEEIGHPDISLIVTTKEILFGVRTHQTPVPEVPMVVPLIEGHCIRGEQGELRLGPRATVHHVVLDGGEGRTLILRHTHGIVALLVYHGLLGHPHTPKYLWGLNQFISFTYGQDALTGWEPLFPLKLMKALQDAVYVYGQGFGDEVEDTFDQ